MSLRIHRLTIAAVLALTACARPNASVREEASAPARSHSDYSVYELGSSWRDQGGAVRTLASLRGEPRLLAFVYTHCSAVCPITVAELKRIEEATPANVGIVLVSLDPTRDSAQQLAMYASEHGLGARWTLLSGTNSDVRDLAVTLGVRYQQLANGDLAHGNVITVLDAEGQVVHQQAGADAGEEIVGVVKGLTDNE